jgi:hypothetical protein
LNHRKKIERKREQSRMKELNTVPACESPASRELRRASVKRNAQRRNTDERAAGQREAKRSAPFSNALKKLAAAAFVVWCLASVVSAQSDISGRKDELDALREKVVVLERENEELRDILYEEDERAFMERIAVESLGYAYPNERRFIDKTRN